MFLSIHHAFVVKSIELITYQHFGEWIGIVLLCVNHADFYHIISHMLSYTPVTQYYSFIIK